MPAFIKQIDYQQEPKRDILCIDIKSFFASVEAVERKIHPLKSMIAVVSRPEAPGGVVLAASPRVKKEYGIKTGSRLFEFPKQSNIQIVNPRMALYLQRNLDILKIFKRYVPSKDLYVYSIDESFLDITHSHALFGSNIEIANQIQDDIWKEMGLIATFGIGDNPLLAKLALDNEGKYKKESNYIANWHYHSVSKTIWRIENLTNFWGIGKHTAEKLTAMGIGNIYQLSQYDVGKLKQKFGVLGEQLFFHAHGVDRTILSDTYVPKSTSYSKNQILYRDYTSPYEIEIVIREMTEENAMRLRKHQQTTSLLKLGIGYSDTVLEKGFNHQMPIEATDSSKKLADSMINLFRKYYQNLPVRVINVTFGHLQAKQLLQLNLFEAPEEIVANEELNKVIDHIRQKYGYTSLLHASSLLSGGMAIHRDTLLGGHHAGKEDET